MVIILVYTYEVNHKLPLNIQESNVFDTVDDMRYMR